MNKVYTYNNSFSSFFSLVAYLIKNNIKPDDIKSKDKFNPNLFSKEVYLDYNDLLLLKKLKNHLTKNVFITAYYVYLSEDENKEMYIYNFILYALKYNNKIFLHRELDFVNKCLELSKKVGREAHLMKGFLRFKLMKNNFYYAEINPTQNVIGIVTNHFKKRLSLETFIIKDVNRNIFSIYYDGKVLYLTQENIKELNLDLDRSEEYTQDLWKSFFKTIGIKERYNPKCQMNFMPKKYWDNIIEMEDKL